MLPQIYPGIYQEKCEMPHTIKIDMPREKREEILNSVSEGQINLNDPEAIPNLMAVIYSFGDNLEISYAKRTQLALVGNLAQMHKNGTFSPAQSFNIEHGSWSIVEGKLIKDPNGIIASEKYHSKVFDGDVVFGTVDLTMFSGTPRHCLTVKSYPGGVNRSVIKKYKTDDMYTVTVNPSRNNGGISDTSRFPFEICEIRKINDKIETYTTYYSVNILS